MYKIILHFSSVGSFLDYKYKQQNSTLSRLCKFLLFNMEMNMWLLIV